MLIIQRAKIDNIFTKIIYWPTTKIVKIERNIITVIKFIPMLDNIFAIGLIIPHPIAADKARKIP